MARTAVAQTSGAAAATATAAVPAAGAAAAMEEAEGALWRLVCGGGPTGLESPLGVAVQVDSVKIRVESAPGFTARI